MQIIDLLNPNRIACHAPATSKKQVLESLSHLIADQSDYLTVGEVFTSLLARERLGSTGLGHGVALPHGRMGDGAKAVGALMTLERAIDFDAVDDQPVDLLFGLIVPEEATDEHLQILAQMARMFSDERFCKEIRRVTDPARLFDLMAAWREPDSSAA